MLWWTYDDLGWKSFTSLVQVSPSLSLAQALCESCESLGTWRLPVWRPFIWRTQSGEPPVLGPPVWVVWGPLTLPDQVLEDGFWKPKDFLEVCMITTPTTTITWLPTPRRGPQSLGRVKRPTIWYETSAVVSWPILCYWNWQIVEKLIFIIFSSVFTDFKICLQNLFFHLF